VRVCMCNVYLLIRKKVTTSDYTDYNRLHAIGKAVFCSHFSKTKVTTSDYA
jgi:hypothetical protein